MQCLVCRSESRPVKYSTVRVQICQWCVTLLCEKPIDPDQVVAKFNAQIAAHVDKRCSPRAPEYYRRQACQVLGYPEKAGFFESLFHRARIERRAVEISAKSGELTSADVVRLNLERESIKQSATENALGRERQPTTTTFGYRGWAKTEDLIHPTLVKYLNAIHLNLVSGTSKCDRPNKPEWETLRQLVLEQDRYRCRICNAYPKEKHVHHIVPISKFGSNHPNNLVTLCYRCHDRVHPDIKVSQYAPQSGVRDGRAN